MAEEISVDEIRFIVPQATYHYLYLKSGEIVCITPATGGIVSVARLPRAADLSNHRPPDWETGSYR